LCRVLALIALVFALMLVLPTTAGAFPRSWLRDALCVHGYEASWTNPGVTWDGRRSKYYGGMQFDLLTWRANGGLRFARYPHHATPREQLLVAYTTWKQRGWRPWPNTARRCGLI
jgi:hypothetical protein